MVFSLAPPGASEINEATSPKPETIPESAVTSKIPLSALYRVGVFYSQFIFIIGSSERFSALKFIAILYYIKYQN